MARAGDKKVIVYVREKMLKHPFSIFLYTPCAINKRQRMQRLLLGRARKESLSLHISRDDLTKARDYLSPPPLCAVPLHPQCVLCPHRVGTQRRREAVVVLSAALQGTGLVAKRESIFPVRDELKNRHVGTIFAPRVQADTAKKRLDSPDSI